MGFRNLEVQKVPHNKVVALVLNQLKGDPVLHVMHLGEANAEFWNDALAKANTRAIAAGGAKRTQFTPQMVRDAREKNREIVSKYAVKDVENIKDDDGNPATIADIPAIIRSLPDEVFDSVLAFVSNAENFRERTFDDDPKELAGKSRPG